MRVEVETDEARDLSVPRRFHFDWRAIEVVEMLDQWFGADHRYCKLRGGNGALYILRLDENRHEWSLTSSQARKPRRSLRNPASACIRISNPTVNDEAILDPRRQRS